jgi:hypothetical protein
VARMLCTINRSWILLVAYGLKLEDLDATAPSESGKGSAGMKSETPSS